MRVLILRQAPCARARVQAAALRSARPDIHFGLARGGGQGGERLTPEWELGERPARALREAIAEYAPDLIHSHGPSARLTVYANELTAGRIPVIFDVGALAPGAHDEDPLLEARAVEESTALVAPSQELLEELGARHRLPRLTCVFPGFPLARELPPEERHLSAEASIQRIASLYDTLVREPIVGIFSLH
jgi:Glycosyltransferase Family 4